MNDISPRTVLPDKFSSIATKIINGHIYGRTHFDRQELHQLIPYVVLLNQQRHTLAYEDMVNKYGHPNEEDATGFYIGRLYDDVMDHSAEASHILSEMIQNVFTKHQIVKHMYPHILLRHLGPSGGGE